MIEDIRNIKSNSKVLRQFGITISIILLLIGSVLLWQTGRINVWLFSAAALFLFLSLAFPALFKQIYFFWMVLAVVLNWIMTRLILGLLFYLLVTPIGLISRLCGKHFLSAGFRHGSSESYWQTREQATSGKENYEKQF